jgi:hypothetical protein
VPLVALIPVVVTVSGLSGAHAMSGALVKTSDSSEQFSARWDDDEKRMILTTLADTIPNHEYSMCRVVTNGRCSQSSPAVRIETSGFVIQPTDPSPAQGSNTSVLRIDDPKIIEPYIKQVDSTAGGPNELTIRFALTVDLRQKEGKVTSIIVQGLRGVVLPIGNVSIGGSSQHWFSSCKFASAACVNGTALWGEGRDTLTLFLQKQVKAKEIVEVKLKFTNAETSQDGSCSISLHVHSEELGCPISPLPLLSAPELRGTAEEALRIHPKGSNARCCAVKMISQSTCAPGATNTLSVVLRPPLSLSSDHVLVISGLLGSNTPDSMVRLLNSSKVFRPRARWTSATGSLTLAIASGYSLPNGSNTSISFDLENPFYPQDSPILITVSVPGHPDIETCAMDTGLDDKAPLLVHSPKFDLRTVQQESNMPGSINRITVSIRPNVVLSKTRKSVIVIDGLRGSSTVDTASLPLDISEGQGLASTASWHRSSGTLSVQVQGQIGITLDTVFSFVIENGYSRTEPVFNTHIMALGSIPIGAMPLLGNALHIVDPYDFEEIAGICTWGSAQCGEVTSTPAPNTTASRSTSNDRKSCSSILAGIMMGRALYTLKVELQCNSLATDISIRVANTSVDKTLIKQPENWCQDQ